MLFLKNIVKDYRAGSLTVHALKGVSVNFRKSEFVSVLGPSGCGKTTLLNIIGGLDHYTSGDLIINGKSTRFYGDREWDVYRNHRIGFIFQSYNLIPHQTVLENVELALTIAGVKKEERVKKAKLALDRVGLSGEYGKKPNQLSGGQCQRVAIARALVNDPEILLADEPTGALDTVTSIQIMDLIKEISAERLVIMVTHNAELAEKYSTRIVRLKDGEIIEDSDPYIPERAEEAEKESGLNAGLSSGDILKEKEICNEKQGYSAKNTAKSKKKERAKMSFFTAFGLSLRNLLGKKGRTVMVGIAGSIGIIGIALVLAFSAGIKGYVVSMQDDMLSGNPITITEEGYDFSALTDMMNGAQKSEIVRQPDRAYINSLVKYLADTSEKMNRILIKNEITDKYVQYVKEMPEEYYSAMLLGYGTDLSNNLYAEYKKTAADAGEKLSVTAITDLYMDILKRTDYGSNASYLSSLIPSFQQAPSSEEYIKNQYDVYGKIAAGKNEIMLVLDKQSRLSDILLARLGYYTREEFLNLIYSTMKNGGDYMTEAKREYFDFDELLSESSDKRFTWHANNAAFQKDASATPNERYKYNFKESDIAADEKAVDLRVVGILSPKENVSYGCLSTGVYYTEAFTDYVLKTAKSESDGIISAFSAYADKTELTAEEKLAVASLIAGTAYSYEYSFKGEDFTFNSTANFTAGNTSSIIKFGGSGGTEIDYASLARIAIRTLGGNDLANSISFYPVSFDDKNLVTDYLDKWNGEETLTVNGEEISAAERADIRYSDSLSLVISIIKTLIDVVSYALIAFTSVSLVVSTVMIGIITYVSVVERIKEIGVIRALGGRKKDVGHLFNAETFILGTLSGIIGIAATYLVSFIVNAVLYPITKIKSLAALPLWNAAVLILLSIFLTLISGLIPAASAARKDPVIALRTE